MVNDLDYKGIEFTVSQKNIYINVFCYENDLTYPVYVSNERFENCMDLLLMADENRLHYICIKDFNRFMFNKTKHKGKKHFCRYCLLCFSSKES